MDKRWQDRFPVSFEIIINYPALGLLRGKVLNLSQAGMYITTVATSIGVDTDIELIIYLPEISETPFHIAALVIHNDEQGIGIMFKEKQQFNQAFLKQLNVDVSHQQFRTI